MTGLPVVRVARAIDPLVRRSAELGFLNGHVPVTAVITAAAVVAAVLDGRDAVVLSNEWSASAPTLVADGHPVNHQWSKGEEFERGFAELVLGALGPGLSVFSYLRPRTELWVSREFAPLDQYHGAFRSCNRAFHQDPAQRLDHWCGRCDKCCFIDLVLAPFMERSELATVFGGSEPLENPDNEQRFRSLVGLGADDKPFECVGDLDECRAAALGRRATGRPGRRRAPPPAARRARRRHARSEHRRRRPARAAGRPPHPGSLCTRRSPGPRSLTRRSASGGWASRGRPASVASAPWAACPSWSTTRPPGPKWTGSRSWRPGRGASTRCSAATSWSRARGSAATGRRWRASRQRGSPSAGASASTWPRQIRPGWPASPGPRARARRPRWPCTCSPGSATAPGPEATSAGRPGIPPPSRNRTTGWSRRRASRSPTCTAPRVVAVTSLAPDHLDWHGTVERYYADKLSLCTKPGVAHALADGSDEVLRGQAGLLGPHVRGSARPRSSATRPGQGTRAPRAPQRAQRVHRPRRARRAGDHRSERRRAARGCGGGVRRAAQPVPFPGRRRWGRVRRRRPVDHRAAGPGRAAHLRGTAGRVAGGRPRPRRRLRAAGRTVAQRRAPTLVVTMPDNGPRIGAAVRDAGEGAVEVLDAADLEAAVEAAFGWAPAGGGRAALPGRTQLRALRRLPGAVGRLRGGGRPLRSAQLSGVNKAPWRVPAPRAR